MARLGRRIPHRPLIKPAVLSGASPATVRSVLLLTNGEDMQLLKQSTGTTVIVGPVLDSAGSSYTGMAITDFNLTKNGSTAALTVETVSHSHNGMYLLTFTTGNTDTLGRLAVSCNKATYAMPISRYEVLQSTVFDAIVTNATTAVGGLGDIQRLAGAAITATTSVTFPAACTVATTTGAVGSVTGAVGSISGVTFPTNFGATSITAGGIVKSDLDTIKTQSVTCAAPVTVPALIASTTNITGGTITTATNLTNLPTMPTDWITSTGLATSAVDEIALRIFDETTAGHATPDSFGVLLKEVLIDTGTTLQADIDNIQTRLPAALSGAGNMQVNVNEWDGGAVPALETAAEFATTMLDTDASTHVTSLTLGQMINEMVATNAEPSQGAPSASASLATKIAFLYKNWRNRKTQTATTWSLYADDGTTVDHKSTVSDNGTTADKTEIVTGP